MSHPNDTFPNGPKNGTSEAARSKAEFIMDYRSLRGVIGAIAILLVPVVYIGNWLFIRHVGGCYYNPQWVPGSLSAFYYTHMRNLFVGAMWAMGVFFVAYRGHDRWDNRLTNMAGVAALFIALFPTMPPSHLNSKGHNLFFTSKNPCAPSTLISYNSSPNQSGIRWVHVAFLILLFVMVFLMVLVQFTRTERSSAERRPEERGIRAWWNVLFPENRDSLVRRIRKWWKKLFPADRPTRRLQNRVFVICAAVIGASAVLASVSPIWPSTPLLLFAESAAFLFFGIAWFVKDAPRHWQSLIGVLSRTIRRPRAGDSAVSAAGQET
jgi:hypothetical protein